MTPKRMARGAGLIALLLTALAAFGCGGKKPGIHLFIPNKPPTVELTSAPVDSRDTTFYAYRISWSGNDEDGRVDHYEYAIDPKDGPDTSWVRISKNELIVFFRATVPVMGGKAGDPIRSVDPHTFVIRAVDNSGARSETKARSFFSYTVAPTVSITNPRPLPLIVHSVTPSVRITWVGTDPDGQFTQKPVKYKFKLLGRSNPDVDIDYMTSHPDSLRRFYAKTNFASWDSVGGDTLSHQFTGLTPNSDYIFVVIGYDEAGAYSPLFTLYNNIVQFQVGYATTLGPKINAFNEFFNYAQPSGGFVPGNPLSWVNLEVPANQKITFYWFAVPPQGANIDWYRWKIDGNVDDETPRTDEFKDWYHWSQAGVGTTQCTIGPFGGSEDHKLYIEAEDNNQTRSILVIHFKPVEPTWNKELLILDDTRLDVDQFVNGQLLTYTGLWPARAELDTFLFARGGFDWKGSKTPGKLTYPGLFAGYDFDTLGTRQGFEIESNSVPLSMLGHYKRLVWMVDSRGGHNNKSGADPTDPVSALHYMCTPGHPNTLSTYIYEGGKVWMLGGTAAYATLIEYNARGSGDNDGTYGPYILVFSNSRSELAPGRIMYDAARWQNEMVYHATNTNLIRFRQLLKDSSGVTIPQRRWSQPGWRNVYPRHTPDYTRMPASLRTKAEVRGDTLPPTRTAGQRGSFFNSVGFDVEYISQPTWIIEDVNANPDTVVEESVLDTLMQFVGGSLVTLQTGYATAPSMTYYHGTFSPEFVFSGFNIWQWNRPDLIKLVDFVLHEIWGMNRDNTIVRAPQLAAERWRAAGAARPTNVPSPVRARVPAGRSSPGR